MAYKTSSLKKKALKAIKEYNLIFIEDIVAYLPCSKSTFYEHFPNESNDYKELVERLEQNRVETKVELRGKWRESNNATLQMGLMKLLATDSERRRLAMEYREHSGSVSLFDALTEEPHESDRQEK